MRLSELSGKKVCILGFGREGQATLRAIERHAPDAYVTIADKDPTPIDRLIAENSASNPLKLKHGITTHAGDLWLREIESFDVIVKSPGIPPNPALDAVADRMTTATNLFFGEVEETGALIVGVTGSKGKSTTSSLLHAMLLAGGKDAYLVGNIGKPALDQLGHAKAGAIFVHELSSYQLMDLRVSPRMAVVTSFFPEHLDYHGSLEAYMDAKKNIARFQGPKDVALFNAKSTGAAEIAKQGGGRKVPYMEEDSPVTLEETRLLGAHNLLNIAGAALAARYLEVPEDAIKQAAKDFVPLPHRLQLVGAHHGIEWVDDAISTTPQSAIAALDALGDNVSTMILGGQDRGYDFMPLAVRIKDSNVQAAILFPGSGEKIEDALKKVNADVQIAHAASMEIAVAHAKKLTPKGRICLLSTASPSYGMFKNFEDKGDQFQRCIVA